ncbi:hypothetical protein A5791_23635 [Mycobacterium sp. 852002-51163_SCH5372311]|uniref:hypothetical protein n=1 Tax=Mycobacterium sp. 852002-51163_SCH5372311 TaxID=1834097 RepID=UPI0007FB93F8|nr:hypothetical protein [Mycobacterium sp. 852002-51163_SCH5372311]OBF85003.1 hypothetical protein A5791_23635 [Mycobacterium sp. 852002-51163_SCH5372311]
MSDNGEGLADETGQVIQRAFGADNRHRLLNRYFSNAGAVEPSTAWEHVYRLLLWLDPTIGLAHCYESDKCRPGRPWYARSLAFHAWLADALGVDAGDLGDEIDILFRWATEGLAAAASAQRGENAARAEEQRSAYSARQMPLPGEDPELVKLILDTLGDWLSKDPPEDILRDLTERIRLHVTQENKRKNLLGEGFEDTVAAILRRIPAIAEKYEIRVRPWLDELPGFYAPRAGEKPRQVDLALIRPPEDYRILITCKWSVRSDREEQFATDFEAYARYESAGQAFDYTLLTNEFDPARLAAACENRRGPTLLFTSVVHINPDGLGAAYNAPVPRRGEGIRRALEHLESGRLESIEQWLQGLIHHAT